MTHDLVVRGGTVVDGTGAPARTADVAVRDGRIVEVGRIDGAARRTIDADGLLVTPGFVDIHTHFDGQATWDPHLTPSCWHGVTTVVAGNCGVGFAPADPAGRQALIDLMEGVEDIPGTALSEGMTWDWETFPQYLDALERFPRALDIGTQVPHAAVRAYVMGDRCHDDATPDEVEAMRRIVVEGLRAGALGFSTGRTNGHRDIHGAPVPGTTAALDEVEALFSAVVEAGHGVCQLVPSGVGAAVTSDADDALERELGWLLPYAERTGQPITFLAMEHLVDPEGWRSSVFDAVRAANARGADVRPQVASRCFGILVGLQSRMNPFQWRPSYRAVAELPLTDRVRALRDPERRARILAEQPGPADRPSPLNDAPRFDRIFPLTRDPSDPHLDYEPRTDESIAALAAAAGADPWEVLYDRMLEQDGREFLLFPVLNYGHDSYDGLHAMLSDPLTVQGLGDGGAHAAVVCDASMTTFLLTHWVRDRTRGPRLELEDVVRRLTSDGAALYGLHDRGLVAPGMRADLNVIDLEGLSLCYPERVTDLPAGAGRLVQRSTGYIETIVAGETVVADGELTDARPGRVVRGPQTP